MKKKSMLGKFFSGATSDSQAEAGSMDRQYIAEQLEARVLYSAVPVVLDLPVTQAEQAPAEINADPPDGIGIKSLEEFGLEAVLFSGQSEIAVDHMISLLSFDELSTGEVEKITSTAIERWRDSGREDESKEASGATDNSMIDLEGPVLGYGEGSHVFLDSDPGEVNWAVESAPVEEGELFMDEDGILDAINRIEMR